MDGRFDNVTFSTIDSDEISATFGVTWPPAGARGGPGGRRLEPSRGPAVGRRRRGGARARREEGERLIRRRAATGGGSLRSRAGGRRRGGSPSTANHSRTGR